METACKHKQKKFNEAVSWHSRPLYSTSCWVHDFLQVVIAYKHMLDALLSAILILWGC